MESAATFMVIQGMKFWVQASKISYLFRYAIVEADEIPFNFITSKRARSLEGWIIEFLKSLVKEFQFNQIKTLTQWMFNFSNPPAWYSNAGGDLSSTILSVLFQKQN